MADHPVSAPDELQEYVGELEAELEAYPDERGEILCEIAATWLKLGEPDRAVAIWRDLIAEGGEEGDYAQVALAEHLFDQGQDEAARAELAALKATRRTYSGAWELAAELFEECGELAESLVWYTMATERFTAEDLDALSEAFGWASRPGGLVRRRRTLRNEVGLPPDETDQLLPDEDEILEQLREPIPFAEEPVDTVRARPGLPTEVRMLFWPRSEFGVARKRWPDLIGQDVTEPQYYGDLEAELDALASEGASRVSAVPYSIESFAVAVDALGDRSADPTAATHKYLDARYAEGHHVQWPPPRNQPCWCGSGTKYKKCCWAPAH
jgi:tetratricopeptide (TPR) repeat protein